MDDAEKRMRTFLPVDWDPSRWVDTGLPDWIETFMRSGVVVEPVVEPPVADHPFYEWESDEHLLRAIMEADRHLSVGALEYVPDESIRDVVARSIVHPWVVVMQGAKWRLCHDYSVGTNRFTRVAPFALPSPWDVRSCVKPGSYLRQVRYQRRFLPRAGQRREPEMVGGEAPRDGEVDVGATLTVRLDGLAVLLLRAHRGDREQAAEEDGGHGDQFLRVRG